MSTKNKMIHTFTYNGLLQIAGWIAMLGLCIFFYKERACYSDGSDMLIKMIVYEKPVNVMNRYLNYIVTILPVIAVKMQWSLKTVMILYSLSPYLLLCISTIILYYVTGNSFYTWIPLVATVWWTNASFYYVIFEYFTMGLALCLVLMLWNGLKNGKQKQFFIIGIIASVLMVMSHPLAIVVFLGGLGFLFIEFSNDRKNIIYLIIIVFVFYFINKWLKPFNPYESNIIETLKGNLKSWRTLDNAYFRNWLKSHYLNSIFYKAILIITAGILIARKKYTLILFIIIGTIILHYTACLINYQYGPTPYQEQYYLIVGYFLILAIFYALESMQDIIRNTILFLIVCYSLLNIILNAKPYTERIQSAENLIDQCIEQNTPKKIVILRDMAPRIIVADDWVFGMESIILSKLKGHDLAIVIKDNTDFVNDTASIIRKSDNVFIGEAMIKEPYLNLGFSYYQKVILNDKK